MGVPDLFFRLDELPLGEQTDLDGQTPQGVGVIDFHGGPTTDADGTGRPSHDFAPHSTRSAGPAKRLRAGRAARNGFLPLPSERPAGPRRPSEGRRAFPTIQSRRQEAHHTPDSGRSRKLAEVIGWACEQSLGRACSRTAAEPRRGGPPNGVRPFSREGRQRAS